ncbi:MAG: hypothetical protein EOP45_08280 [Sphingobacteriaceae bacterium]|nr:MAG: hypothetical protein EOP45_08280 [Sphingobacteriaceae bacterium]
MAVFGAFGTWSILGNAVYSPTKSNWASIGASDLTTQLSDATLMNTDGSITIATTGLYNLTVSFVASEFNFLGSGSISVLYVAVGSTAFSLGSVPLTTSFLHTMTFNAGDQLVFRYTLSVPTTANFTIPSTSNCIRLNLVDASKPYFYYASTSIPPLLNPQPRSLDFRGVINSGFQVSIPITIDGKSTGIPAFITITGVSCVAVSPSATNSVTNVLTTSLDPIPSSLKFIVVNASQSTIINTLLASSAPTAVNPPAGTMIFLTVTGW